MAHEIKKAADIIAASAASDFDALSTLADSQDGFLTNELRQQAWQMLLGIEGVAAHGQSDWKELPPHKDEDQVRLDVNRALFFRSELLGEKDEHDAEDLRRKKDLELLIIEVLRRNPHLHYFQGFHDICQVFFLVIDPSIHVAAVSRLCALRIRDFMLPKIEPATKPLHLIADILLRADPELAHHVAGLDPHYALSSTLTMYAHNLRSLSETARVFDVLLAREPAFSLYLFTAIVQSRRDILLDFGPDEKDVMYATLGKLPEDLDLDALIQHAIGLAARFPPTTLRTWKSISSASVLKTARSTAACAAQTMDEAQTYFAQQVLDMEAAERVRLAAEARRRQRELRRRQMIALRIMLWRYRGPAAAVAVAVAVGAIAIWLPRTSNRFVSCVFSFVSKLSWAV